ncbi:Pbp1p [Rhodotorula paludigena]|uniref:Pbp1p n=1 Tax=Rhodotorula paludigena TaxID=86838 RepID=UPI00317E495C
MERRRPSDESGDTVAVYESHNHSAPHHDRWAWILLALTGHPVVATLKGGTRVRGILAAATPDQGDLSIALRHAAYLDPSPDASSSAAPPKPALLINGRDLVALEAADLALDLVGHPSSAASSSSRPASSTAATDVRDSFRTDTDISGQARLGKERTLQAWGAGAGAGGADDSGWGAGAADDSLEGGGLSLEDEYAPGNHHHRRGVNGGGNKPGKGWDQFAANERQFGLKTDYDDELYTTKLDRSGADFKAREARAAQLEREIMKGTSALANNAHVAEERGEQAPDDGTLNEEDRYGAVIRGEGAYVPPGARKAALARLQQGQQQQQQQNGAADAAAVPAITTTAPPAAPAAAGSADAPSAQGGNGNGKDLQSSLQHFVTNERVRLEQRKAQMQQAQQQALAKKEQDSKLASLVQWSQTFKNPYPLSDELATILGKKPGSSTSAQKAPSTAGGASTGSPAVSPTATNRTAPSAPAKSPSPAPSAAASSALKKPFVAEIPPFDPARAKARQAASDPAHKAGGATSPAPAASAAPAAAAAALQPKAPTSKLSATSAAFVFKPRASAAPFTPGASLGAGKPTSPAPPPAAPAAAAPIASSSAAAPPAAPASASTSTGAALNPFFGDKQIKKGSSSMHVKEDFTPFKTGVLAEPNSIAPQWSQFSGKPYRAIYPPQAHPLGIADEAAAAQAAQQAQQQAVQAHQAMQQQQQQQAMQMAGGGAPGAAGGPGGIMDPNSVAAIAQAQAAHHQQQQQHQQHHHPQQQQQHHPHQHHQQQQQQMHHHPHLQQHLHAAAVMGMHGGGGGMPPPPPPGAQGFNPGAPPFGAAPPFPGVGARGSVPPPPPFQGFVPPPPPPPHGAQGSPFPGPPPLPQGSAPMFASPPLAGTSPHPPHSMLAVAAQAQQANGMSSPPPGAGGAAGGGAGGARYMPWTPGQNPGMPPPPPPPQGFVPPPPPQ